jgi:hypothetical protein
VPRTADCLLGTPGDRNRRLKPAGTLSVPSDPCPSKRRTRPSKTARNTESILHRFAICQTSRGLRY